MITIYGLHTGDEVIRYVGQTRQEPHKRLQKHRSNAKYRMPYNPEFKAWLNLSSVEFIVLARVEENGDAAEAEWIAKFPNLFNRTTGGVVGFTVSDETVALHEGDKNHFYGQHLRGADNPFFGRRHAVETRTKVSGQRNANAKLTREQVDEIIRRRNAGERQKDLAMEFGVGQMQVSRIVRGLRWGNGLS